LLTDCDKDSRVYLALEALDEPHKIRTRPKVNRESFSLTLVHFLFYRAVGFLVGVQRQGPGSIVNSPSGAPDPQETNGAIEKRKWNDH